MGWSSFRLMSQSLWRVDLVYLKLRTNWNSDPGCDLLWGLKSSKERERFWWTVNVGSCRWRNKREDECILQRVPCVQEGAGVESCHLVSASDGLGARHHGDAALGNSCSSWQIWSRWPSFSISRVSYWLPCVLKESYTRSVRALTSHPCWSLSLFPIQPWPSGERAILVSQLPEN